MSLAEATRVWWRIGWASFGGPTAQIALMHRVLVDEQHWLSDEEFLRALGFCMLLPGPEAMQLATYAGWRLHGTRGGLVAGLLFVLPGATVVLALATIYAVFGQVPLVTAAFRGIQATVLVLVFEAMQRLSKRALRTRAHVALAVLAFVALFAFAVPFPWVVLAAGAWGALRASAPAGPAPPPVPRPSLARTATTAATWLALWWAPLLAIPALLGREHVLWKLAGFFSRLAMVTFGGAYAVLAYMSQDVVARHHWLTLRQMVDALGLAETTPGPLILVTEFVGFLAAQRSGGGSLAWGLAGAAVALWATFVPCFLWIMTGAPWLDRLTGQPRLRGALDAITAAVLGVIANLAVWFAIHVSFTSVRERALGPVRVALPDVAALDPRVLVLTLVSAWLLLRLRWSVHGAIAAMAGAALVWHLLSP